MNFISSRAMKFCECGCGQRVSKLSNRFVRGHNNYTRENKERMRKNKYALGCKHSEEANRRKGQRQKGKHQTEETKQKIREGNIAYWSEPVHRAIRSQQVSKLWQDSEYRRQQKESHTITYSDPTFRKGAKQRNARLWQNPEYVRRWMKSNKIKPNGSELRLESILSQVAPDFRYNGDFSLGISIGGKIPDFVNINSRKQVIEMFGCFWHRCPVCSKGKSSSRKNDEKQTIRKYAKYGFSCLIVWEHELNSMNTLIERIGKFIQ